MDSANNIGNEYLKLHGNYRVIRIDTDRNDIYNLENIQQFTKLFHNNLEEIQFLGSNFPQKGYYENSIYYNLFNREMAASLIDKISHNNDIDIDIDEFINKQLNNSNDSNNGNNNNVFKSVNCPNLYFLVTYYNAHTIKFPFDEFFQNQFLMKLFKFRIFNL